MQKVTRFGLMVATLTLLAAPALAQGQGGYAPGVPGAETVRMSSAERAQARAMHRTNDTNGGRSSIDKSGKTWEGGDTSAGPQPGSITFRADDAQVRRD